MIYLILLAVTVWLLGYANEQSGLRQNNYKPYIIFAGTMVALVMGLRTRWTGSSDTRTYIIAFNSIKNYDSFIDYYDKYRSESEFIFSETGFYFFAWLLTRVTSEGQMLVLVSSAFITFAACRFIYKNVKDVPTGLLIYVCLGLFTFNMSGMRQAMAMSVCILGYEFVKKRKFIRFILTILLAMQFHKTAICFAPVYFLPMLKEGKFNTVLYLAAMGVFLLAMDWFIETYNAFTGEEYEINNEASGGGFTVILIYIATISLALLMHKCLKKREIQSAFYGVIAGFTTYIARFFSTQIMERISYYFFYFTLLLIPNIFDELDEKERQTVKIIFGILAVLLFWYRLRGGAFRYFNFYFLVEK